MAKDIFTKALKLPLDERAQLAHELLVSLDDGAFDPNAADAWDVEIVRRVSDFSSGKSKAIPWDEARARIVKALKPASKRRSSKR